MEGLIVGCCCSTSRVRDLGIHCILWVSLLEPLQVRYEQASSPGRRRYRLSTLQCLAGQENRSQELLRALQKPQPIVRRDDHSLGTPDAQSNAQSRLSPCAEHRVYRATLKMSSRQGFVR